MATFLNFMSYFQKGVNKHISTEDLQEIGLVHSLELLMSLSGYICDLVEMISFVPGHDDSFCNQEGRDYLNRQVVDKRWINILIILMGHLPPPTKYDLILITNLRTNFALYLLYPQIQFCIHIIPYLLLLCLILLDHQILQFVHKSFFHALLQFAYILIQSTRYLLIEFICLHAFEVRLEIIEVECAWKRCVSTSQFWR